jgi:hypothetical protein
MEFSLKTISEAYACALFYGFVNNGEVVAWVDSVISELEQPHMAFLDASLSRRRKDFLISALHEVPGEFERSGVTRLLFGHMLNQLKSDHQCGPHIAYILYEMALSGEVEGEPFENSMLCFDDDFAIARSKIHGSFDEVVSSLKSFLIEYSEAV